MEIGGRPLDFSLPITTGEGAGGVEGVGGVGGLGADRGRDDGAGEGRAGGAGFISLWFRCSSVYARGYKTRDGSAYFARCPKCGKTISLPIGAGGTTQRSFQVSCR